jgi:transglutaminase-like putative cysteine protease
MRFRISHETVYNYATPASESVGELRIYPVDTPEQSVTKRAVKLDPLVSVDTFTDYFGNTVGCFAIPFRHKQLQVRMSGGGRDRARVRPRSRPRIFPVGEARRLTRDRRIELVPLSPGHAHGSARTN